MFAMRCEQKGLRWTTDARIGDRAIRSDDSKLRQVLSNLLGNAVKFTDGGRIRLQVAQRDRHGRAHARYPKSSRWLRILKCSPPGHRHWLRAWKACFCHKTRTASQTSLGGDPFARSSALLSRDLQGVP